MESSPSIQVLDDGTCADIAIDQQRVDFVYGDHYLQEGKVCASAQSSMTMMAGLSTWQILKGTLANTC